MAKDLKIKPLGGRVLIEPMDEEAVSDAGLIIPATAEKEKPQQGTIVAVGTGKIEEDGSVRKFSVKVGDKVVFKKYSPDEIEIDGIEYLVIDEDDILAVVA